MKVHTFFYINSVITEHSKTSHKLSKTKEVGSNSSLDSGKKNWENIVKITKWKHVFKGFASSYNIEIFNSFNPELQLKDTESAIKSKLIDLSSELRGFKFVTTLVLVFKKIESEDKTKYDTFYSNSKAGVFTNESNIDDIFQSIYTTIISNIQKSLGKGSDRIIDSVIDHTVSISKYNPLAGSSYIKSPKELDYSRKEMINIQNIDDHECFKWSIVRYLNPANHNLVRITKVDKDFAKKLDIRFK